MSKQASQWIVDNVKIVKEDGAAEGSVAVRDGIIEAIWTKEERPQAEGAESYEIIDGQGGYLLPGFIDIHVHGGFGGDFMEACTESYEAITRFHASQGTTGMLATTVTASKEAIEKVLRATADFQAAGMQHAELLGVHLEGPFISEKFPGAQNPAFISAPQLGWVKQWAAEYPGLIKQLTLAPEKEGAIELIEWLAANDIIAACGHTDAKYADMAKAADAGLSHAVHTYNAMRGLHHREPGTLGAVMSDDRIYAELIADGEHVHPAAIRILLAAKPSDKVILISDAISSAGMPDGRYDLGGLPVIVKDGIARLEDGVTLAGSSLTMIRAFRYMMDNTKLAIHEVSRLASGNAAERLGIYDRVGSIAVGKVANLVWTDAELDINRTWVNGRAVYTK